MVGHELLDLRNSHGGLLRTALDLSASLADVGELRVKFCSAVHVVG